MSTFKDERPKHPVNYVRALSILQKLLVRDDPKRIAYEEGLSVNAIYQVRKMFPLFFKFRKSPKGE